MSFDLCTIGQALKRGREERHLSLQEISDALFIRKRIIEAIESGNWDVLPHVVYVRGYVGQYAALLGIEVEIERLAENKIDTSQQELHLLPRLDESRVSWWGTHRKVLGFGGIAAGILAFLIIQNIRRPSYTVGPSQYQRSTGALETVSGTPYQTEGNEVIAESKKLMIACQQRTWVRIVIDGTEKKEFMMNPEEVIVLNGREGFDILIGNAGGVKLFYNGKDIGFAGKEGEVRRINLPEVG